MTNKCKQIDKHKTIEGQILDKNQPFTLFGKGKSYASEEK